MNLHQKYVRVIAAVAACLVVCGCAAPPAAKAYAILTGEPENFPESAYFEAIARGEAVYEIDAARSLIRVYAYRAGALSRIGHNHVVAAREVHGYAMQTTDQHDGQIRIQADLYLSLVSMSVDDAELRAAAKFKREVSESAKTGTRTNMLASLNASEYPYARAHIDALVDAAISGANEISLDVAISLHGFSKTITVPLMVSVDDAAIVAEGVFTLRQTDFGIKPYAVLGGALAVRDDLDFTIEIYAVRLDAV